MPLAVAVKQDEIARELALAIGSVDRKSTIPILGNVLLSATGDRLTVRATDLEVALSASIPAGVRGAGSVTVPARKLLDYVRALPSGADVSIKEGAGNWLTVSAGASKCRMAGMGAESFPEFAEPPASTARIEGDVLARMVRRVEYAIAKEASRFTLDGALLTVDDGRARMVCTDSHRLAMADGAAQGGALRALMPRRLMALALKCAEMTEGACSFAVDENRIHVQIGGRMISGQKMAGNFPDYTRVLPRDLPHVVTVHRAEVAGALARVRSFADVRTNGTRWEVTPDGVRLSAMSSDIGESEEVVSVVSTSGGSMLTGFNAGYIDDFLRSVSTERVSIKYRDGNAAVVLVDGDGEAAGLCVVMPMRYE